jgi:general secretion pathway protein G
MKTRSNPAARGFTLLEFAVTVAVAALLSAVLLNRVDFYREQAEMAAVRQLVGALRTALHARAAGLAAAGRGEALRTLAEDNPMNWLVRKPDNYLGEYYAADPARIGRTGWVFDPRDKSLVYLLSSAESFSFGTSRLLKFKVEFLQGDQPAGLAGAGNRKQRLALNQVSGEVVVNPPSGVNRNHLVGEN